MYTFSELEKDEKTFNYVREYLNHWNSGQKKDFNKLDMEIQTREIITHLYLNGKSGNDNDEILRWIKDHGAPFRAYLNSIKLVFLVWHCMGRDLEEISWSDYCQLRDKMNEIKDICTDTIIFNK
jgi:hypothetical protein